MIDIEVRRLSDDDLGELGFVLSAAARLVRSAFEKRITQAGLGLTAGEARALLTIAESDGSRQLDIAARLGVEPMTLCAYLDKLEGLGLVERQKCTADRRAKRVNLTVSSTEMISALREELRSIIACATDEMGEERRRLLKELLESFIASLQSQQTAQGAAREDQPA